MREYVEVTYQPNVKLLLDSKLYLKILTNAIFEKMTLIRILTKTKLGVVFQKSNLV